MMGSRGAKSIVQGTDFPALDIENFNPRSTWALHGEGYGCRGIERIGKVPGEKCLFGQRGLIQTAFGLNCDQGEELFRFRPGIFEHSAIGERKPYRRAIREGYSPDIIPSQRKAWAGHYSFFLVRPVRIAARNIGGRAQDSAKNHPGRRALFHCR